MRFVASFKSLGFVRSFKQFNLKTGSLQYCHGTTPCILPKLRFINRFFKESDLALVIMCCIRAIQLTDAVNQY